MDTEKTDYFDLEKGERVQVSDEKSVRKPPFKRATFSYVTDRGEKNAK